MESNGPVKFAVLILTNGRPNNVMTYHTLRRQGYTGDVYLLVDNEDVTADKYRERYGNQVIIFDKLDIARRFDEGDNFHDRRAVFYARNACFDVARSLGLTHFLELDDDYKYFAYRHTANLSYSELMVHNLDGLFAAVLDYFRKIPATTIALAQNGDFIGGKDNPAAKQLYLKRKAMNTFFCAVDRPFAFMGRVNEDVNTYVTLGHRGELIFTIFNATVSQMTTQQTAGGMSEMYLDSGTYTKSFYTVMYSPSCVKISELGVLHRRIHHTIDWATAVPRILGEQHRKAPKQGANV